MKRIFTTFLLVGLTTWSMAQNALTRPLIVPEFNTGLVKFYKTDNPTTEDVAYRITVPCGKPNSVALNGNDLYINLNVGCGRIYKYTNYLNVGNAAVVTLVSNVSNDYVGMFFNRTLNGWASI